MMKLGLLNTSILTAPGEYVLEELNLEQAQEFVRLFSLYDDGLDSAIGHQATADVMSELLGIGVPVKRRMFVQQVGQQALVFKLKGRLQEGKILDRAGIEEIGYSFQLLTRKV